MDCSEQDDCKCSEMITYQRRIKCLSFESDLQKFVDFNIHPGTSVYLSQDFGLSVDVLKSCR